MKPLSKIFVHHKWRVVRSTSKYNLNAGRIYAALAPGFLTFRSKAFPTYAEAMDFAHKNAVMDRHLASVERIGNGS